MSRSHRSRPSQPGDRAITGNGASQKLSSPVSATDANLRQLNRFTYVAANPTTLIDPDGHVACTLDSDFCYTGSGWTVNENQRDSESTCSAAGTCDTSWTKAPAPAPADDDDREDGWTIPPPVFTPTSIAPRDCGFLGLACFFGLSRPPRLRHHRARTIPGCIWASPAAA